MMLSQRKPVQQHLLEFNVFLRSCVSVRDVAALFCECQQEFRSILNEQKGGVLIINSVCLADCLNLESQLLALKLVPLRRFDQHSCAEK